MIKIICPKCKTENVVYIDERFYHALGTEITKYYYCEDCDWKWGK